MGAFEELDIMNLIDEKGKLKLESREAMEAPLQALAELMNDKVSSDSGVYVSPCFQSIMFREERPYQVEYDSHGIPTLVFLGTIIPLDRLTCYPEIYAMRYQDIGLYKPVKAEHVDLVLLLIQDVYALNIRNTRLNIQMKRYQCGKISYDEIMHEFKVSGKWYIADSMNVLFEEYHLDKYLLNVEKSTKQLIDRVELIESRRKKLQEHKGDAK